MRGNNLLRRFLLAHHRPSPDGKPLVLPVLIGNWGGSPAAGPPKTIRRIVAQDLPDRTLLDRRRVVRRAPRGIDAGNWDVRKDLYPQGFPAISEPCTPRAASSCSGSSRSGSAPARLGQFRDLPAGSWSSKAAAPNISSATGLGRPARGPALDRLGEPSQPDRRRRPALELGDPAARQFLTDLLSERSPSSASTGTARTPTSPRWNTGRAPTRPTARASPRSATSRASTRSGTNCCGATRT